MQVPFVPKIPHKKRVILVKKAIFLRTLSLAVSFFIGVSACFGAETLMDQARQAVTDYRVRTTELADWCEKNGLLREAKLTRDQLLPSAEDRIYVPTFPKEIVSESVPEDSPELVQKWNADRWKIKKEYAAELQRLLNRAVRQKQSVLAMQMAIAALHADPNHERLRNILGLKNYKNQWRTNWEIRMLKQGNLEHERFGWLPAKYVKRYENGERFYRGKWMPEEEEAKIRSGLQTGWKIESEHYTIATNHSLEEGVRLSRELEDFYRAWLQVFILFHASDDEFSAMFQGRPSVREANLRVVYYKNQEDYIKANVNAHPHIGITGGYFDLEKECCFFFHTDDPEVHKTVFHEATHQLFTCSGKFPKNARSSCNFWITEAVAVYMESFHKENGYCVLGGYNQERLQMARYRYFETKFYVPFALLVRFDIARFQSFPHVGLPLPKDWTLAMLYSQMGGMGHFFMHAEGGKYRELFVEYLLQVYSGRDTVLTLFELSRTVPERLDEA
ncbi:MAG: hypothetical protein LBQ54_04935, partial [Planctomycetaceae bacterium]|nr:hypothetical protein [Planctomycetaceae bacterium]